MLLTVEMDDYKSFRTRISYYSSLELYICMHKINSRTMYGICGYNYGTVLETLRHQKLIDIQVRDECYVYRESTIPGEGEVRPKPSSLETITTDTSQPGNLSWSHGSMGMRPN